jgi:membrane complex biogenesis BtpA family protein
VSGRSTLPRRLVTAMVQVPALPGSPRYDGAPFPALVDRCIEETDLLVDAGFESLQLQNMADEPGAPTVGPETVAFMSVTAATIRGRHPEVNLSVLVNWDGPASLAVGAASGADFIRIEHTFVGVSVMAWGLSEGCCRAVTRLRASLKSDVPIVADVLEPHGVPLVSRAVEDLADDALSSGADGLYVTGASFEESLGMAEALRSRSPETPIYLGGGATADNVALVLDAADGVAVGSWIRGGHPGNPLDEERVRSFMAAVRGASPAPS